LNFELDTSKCSEQWSTKYFTEYIGVIICKTVVYITTGHSYQVVQKTQEFGKHGFWARILTKPGDSQSIL